MATLDGSAEYSRFLRIRSRQLEGAGRWHDRGKTRDRVTAGSCPPETVSASTPYRKTSVPSNRARSEPTMDRMKPFDADSPAELCDKLRANDVRVPPRGQGRTTEACEIWVACRFLAALSETSLLDYPLRVEHGDRPDLVLSLPSGCTGIEIAEAVPETEAGVEALSQPEHPGRRRRICLWRPASSHRDGRTASRGSNQHGSSHRYL